MRRNSLPILMLAAWPLWAQETPTEREAAHEVLHKMATLEKSLDVPGTVTRLTAPNPAREQVVARAKELMDKELLALADDITRNPEVGFVEKRSVQKLKAYLEQHGFDVKMGSGGLETAFVARYKGNNGPPESGRDRRVRRIARNYAGLSRRSTQRAGTGRDRRSGCHRRMAGAHQIAGEHHRVRYPG